MIGCVCARTGELLALGDISVEESEDLPSILGPLAEDGAPAALGGATALDQGPIDRSLLLAAIEAGAPALQKLRVRPFCYKAVRHAWDACRAGIVGKKILGGAEKQSHC